MKDLLRILLPALLIVAMVPASEAQETKPETKPAEGLKPG